MTDAGHVRIRNRLLEAIVSAPFRQHQLKIVLTIFRLSAGWQRQSVKVSLPQLAEYCGCTPAGWFRGQLKELVENAVIVIASEGGGASTNAYGLQEDFERWGKYSQSGAKLEAIWGQRPEHADQLFLRLLTIEHPDRPQAGGVPARGQGACPPAVRGPARPQSGSPDSTVDRAASSERGKTLKDIERQLLPKMDRADALELLSRIEALREQAGGQSEKWIIRRDRIRADLGDDVDDALRMVGGVDAVLKADPRYRGVLVGDLQRAINRVRGHDRKAASA